MGIISKIRQVLGIEAAEQRAAEAAKQQKEMMTVIQATLTAIAAQNAPKAAENVPATAQQEAVQAEKAALEAEIRLLRERVAELSDNLEKSRETAQKASVNAVKNYFSTLKEDLDSKNTEKKPVDGRKFCIRFDSATAERIIFLQDLFRKQGKSWKITDFVNEMTAEGLQRIFDRHPELEFQLKKSLDDALQDAADAPESEKKPL